ncbi:MAG TPA: hypothetical protein VK866_15435 [Acidimicrobiales bacterium]|nr:hypothetical protein [Acidimicrobiales bacterium]
MPLSHDRPPGVDDATVSATGTISEALEYLVRARGHLYSFHQLMGRVDLLLGQGADELEAAGHPQVADDLRTEIVGRNVIEGRWTFQLVEEFDDTYYRPAEAAEQRIRDALLAGRRHVFESEMKDERRTAGASHHERRPRSAGDPSA